MRVKGQLYEHNYEPLIDKPLFDQVQAVFKGYDKKPYRYGCKPFVFRAMVRCALCGCLLSGDIKKGKYVYYYCSNYKNIHENRISAKEEERMLSVRKVLRKLNITDQQKNDLIEDFKKQDKSKNRFVEATMANLTAQFNLYENRKSETWNKYVDKEISKEMYDKIILEYNNKQSEITSKMSKFQVADNEFYTTLNIILSLCQRAEEIFKSSEAHEKRAFANFLLQNCKLDGKKLSFELKTPFNRVFESATSDTMLSALDAVRTCLMASL